MSMTLGKNGLALLESFELFKPNMYDTDGGGHCTVGWGHLIHKGKCDGRENEKAFLKGITKVQGDAILRDDVQRAVNAVNKYVDIPLTENQFDALVSFTYNVGSGNLLDMIKDCKGKDGKIDLSKIPAQMKMYNKSNGKILKGLVRRRQAEVDLFGKK